ncbi:CDP-glycerol glycerophosphotransferase family protein [Microbispora sp. NPDC049125]|uniref:bifunctional glycosyltransferase/CDP-glycerol:glycerophosphate glycerophosphotransferase n=1 Tax=Microbispora sp. NPDC049125 TaxID=3154929 RepID=UPI0034658A94
MPRISVIVPIYDVEPYLAACLESVAAQTWEDLEVVMVDDGSPDGSAEIARGFAERDRRFRLIQQANAGLGAARNTGVRHASGEFLAFLDSDDLLPVHALEHLLASLERTGSDLATGNVQRFDARGARQSALHRPIFAVPAAATHITRTDALLRDRLVTNKLWRRSFWEAHGLRFPEGVLYEDIAVALRAHFLARSVDVLAAPVYLWRRRDGASRSITQDKTRLRHLEDRFAAVGSVRSFLAEHNLRAHIHGWDRAVLDSDLTNFLDVLDEASERFHTRFLDLAGDYLDDVAAPVLDGLPALRRLQWRLVRERRLTDLLEVLAWDRRVEPDRRFVRRLWSHHLDVPLEHAVPAAATRVRDELAPRHRIDAVRWEDGRLVVEGRAASPYLRPARRLHQQVFATLVNERTGRRVRVTASALRTRVSPKSRERDWGGFRLVIDPRLIARPGRRGLWHVELSVVQRGVVHRGRLTDPRATWADRAGHRGVGRDRYVAPLLTETGDLALRADRETARVATQSARDGRLRLVGHLLDDLGPDPALLVTRMPGGVPLRCPVTTDRRTFEATVDLLDILPARRLGDGWPGTGELPADLALLDGPAEWRVDVLAADGTATPVTVADDLPPGRYGLAGREVVVARGRSGGLVLRDQPVAAYADLAEWLPGGELLVEGGFAVPCAVTALVVRSLDRPEERLAPIEGAGERFRARLAAEEVDSPAGRLPLPRGRYGLAVRTEGGADLPVELDSDAPMTHETARRTFELGTDAAGHAVLTVSGDLAGDERGRKAQRDLRLKAYPQMRRRPLWDAVLFSGGSGTRFAGSPRAVCEELRRRGAEPTVLWHVKDGQVALPDGVDAVRSHGREHYEALARCRYVVTDDPLPAWFERRPDQIVVQTWHGPPSTLLGRHTGLLGRRTGDEARERLLAGGAGEWTHLVSAGPSWTPPLREALGFGGEVLETGLPCDDLLRDPGREAVRRRLGLAGGRRVVLYVLGGEDVPALDVDRVASALGEDHVLLVRRPEGPVPSSAALPVLPSPSAPWPAGGAAVPAVTSMTAWDVSAYPDAHDLYLVADVLVTGDVPAAFDFAVTGRPILCHAGQDLCLHPDLPGPSLRAADEVIEAIREIDEVAEKHAGAMEAFLARFRPLADGRAAARLVDRLFG